MSYISFARRPKPEHERVVDALSKFAEDAGMGWPRFQNTEQMVAWRAQRIIQLECLCDRIVGIVVPETRSVEFTSFVIVCFGQIKEKLRIGGLETIHETINSTISWLQRNYPV